MTSLPPPMSMSIHFHRPSTSPTYCSCTVDGPAVCALSGTPLTADHVKDLQGQFMALRAAPFSRTAVFKKAFEGPFNMKASMNSGFGFALVRVFLVCVHHHLC